jgi:hypothetical protein
MRKITAAIIPKVIKKIFIRCLAVEEKSYLDIMNRQPRTKNKKAKTEISLRFSWGWMVS